MKLILAMNIHGMINSSSGVRKTLVELKVSRKFSATVVTDDPNTVGMLKACKDYLSWTELDAGLLTTLLEKRGMVTERERLGAAALKKLGFKNHGELADKMLKEGLRLSAVEGVKPFFRLSPPKGGFKSSLRRQYSDKGTLGSNPKLGEVIRRMA